MWSLRIEDRLQVTRWFTSSGLRPSVFFSVAHAVVKMAAPTRDHMSVTE